MKKTIRRSMGIVMALALLLTGLLCVGTAQADNDKKVTFTDGDTGTITVHKYLSDGHDGEHGTGDALTSELSNESLNNTSFKLTRIASADDAIKYFKGEGGSYSVESDTKGVPQNAIPDNPGEFVFSGVGVGIYILEEYEAPDYIDAPLTRCVVSMPMTNGDGDAWNFDVHVYPKNNVKAPEVHLTKKDQKDSNTLLSNVKFELKKVVTNADGEETLEDVYNVEGDGIINLFTGDNGKLDIVGLPKNTKATYRLYETANTNTGTNGEAYIVNKTPIEFTVDIYNKITGIKTSNKEIAYKVEENAKNVLTITMTNDHPTIDKKVKDVDETDVDNQWKDGTTAEKVSFGTDETVDYRIDVYAPVNVAELGRFEIVDKLPEGQKIDVSTIGFAPNVASFFTEPVDDDGKITWTLKKAETDQEKAALENALAGQTFSITYKANFNEAAELYGPGNTNTVTLTYSKEIDGNSTTKDIVDSTTVYTYDFKIIKKLQEINETDTTAAGAGITFKVSLADGSMLKFTPVKDSENNDVLGKYRLTKDGTTEVVTNTSGVVELQGLDAGSYTLTETKTQAGYNLLTGAVPITVESSTDEVDHISENETTIINKQGFELPQTGSLGFLLFCAAGLVLVLAGAGLMMSGRKRTIR